MGYKNDEVFLSRGIRFHIPPDPVAIFFAEMGQICTEPKAQGMMPGAGGIQ